MSEYANVLQSVAFHGGCETLNPNSLRNMGISMFLLLFVLWVIFNGKVTVEIVLCVCRVAFCLSVPFYGLQYCKRKKDISQSVCGPCIYHYACD